MANETLKNKMLTDAIIILKSIDWAEKEINKKLLEFEVATQHHNYEEMDKIDKAIHLLHRRLSLEEENMDKFMLKYRKLVDYEKKGLLFDSQQKEQARSGSVSA